MPWQSVRVMRSELPLAVVIGGPWSLIGVSMTTAIRTEQALWRKSSYRRPRLVAAQHFHSLLLVANRSEALIKDHSTLRLL
jgi:hypothetical protein